MDWQELSGEQRQRVLTDAMWWNYSIEESLRREEIRCQRSRYEWEPPVRQRIPERYERLQSPLSFHARS